MIDFNYFRYLKGYTLKRFKYLGGRGAVPGLTLQEEANPGTFLNAKMTHLPK